MKKTLTGLDFKIQEMAGRIRELREISGFSEMCIRDSFSTAARWLLALTLQISSRAAAQSFDPIR